MMVIERNRWTVKVEIFPSDTGGWLLQIVDGRGNATIWTETFGTEQAAFDAALHAVDTEGIETFIGPDSELRYLFDS